MKSLLVFIAGSLLLAATSLSGGYWCGGMETLTQASIAFALTFVPSVGTLAWVISTYRSDPNMLLMVSLGGSGLRMAIALGGGLFLKSTQPETFDRTFWIWLVVFYLSLLAFEITLLIRQQPNPN